MIKNPLYRYGDQKGKVPAHCHYGKQMFDNMVENKDLVALIETKTGCQMTFGEFAQMTADVALSLTRIGVGKGDVVCICSDKRFEFLPTVLGIVCTGAVFSPTDYTYSSAPLLHRMKIAQPKVIFCSKIAYETHKAIFEETGTIQHYILYGDERKDGAILFKEFLTETCALEDFEPVPVNGWEDILFIIFSSGTTGLSKGVPLTHLNVLVNSQTMCLEEYKGKKVYITREWYLPYGLMYSLACLTKNATLVYNNNGSLKEMLEDIQKYKVHILQLAPFSITQLIKTKLLDNYDVTSVENIICSSTYIREQEIKTIREGFPKLQGVLQIYGLSEAGCVCNEILTPKGPRAGSSGVPTYGYTIKVADLETREPLGANQVGEICVKGPSVMKGYLNNAILDCNDDEGFLKTGDVGYYDEDGYFFIINRIKELIKCRDASIAPAEFEALLVQHPAVREVGVVGKPHPEHGETPVAFVVLQPGCNVTEDELVEYLKSRDTFRMRLTRVRFVDQLPRAAGTKLDRKELKRLLENESESLSKMVSFLV